jgi:homoserine kinase
MPQVLGLLGVALSGAGPSVIAIVAERAEEIGKSIAQIFERHGLLTTVRHLGIHHEGLFVTEKRSPL